MLGQQDVLRKNFRQCVHCRDREAANKIQPDRESQESPRRSEETPKYFLKRKNFFLEWVAKRIHGLRSYRFRE